MKKQLLGGWAMRFDGTVDCAKAIADAIWRDLAMCEEITTKYAIGYMCAGFAVPADDGTVSRRLLEVATDQWLVHRENEYTALDAIPDAWIDHGDGLTRLTRNIIFDWMNKR